MGDLGLKAQGWHYSVLMEFFSVLLSGLTATSVVFGFLRCLLFFNVLVNSAQNLHDSMFNAILQTPVQFFDVNPIGKLGLLLDRLAFEQVVNDYEEDVARLEEGAVLISHH